MKSNPLIISNERLLAERFGLSISEDLTHYPLVSQHAAIIPYTLAKQKKILPLEETKEGILVAISDPLELEALDELKLLLKRPIQSLYCPKPALEAAIELCYRQNEDETRRLMSHLDQGEEKFEAAKPNNLEGYDLLEQSDQNPVIRMVNAIFLEAIQQGASDIHFEPSEEGLLVRYRIDGVLQIRHTPPRDFLNQIITRIKVMSKMDIAEHRLPQDGRVKLRQGGREIDFRVSTLPVVHGERIVLRILDKGNVVLGLDRIGIDDKLLLNLRKLIHMPEGIILVTGPTGSGKTTTLYSALSEINAEEMNIMTIEDPVEYKLTGISQMSVNSKIELDFARGLRHILRQDPDVIMIGEIRDRETAEIAIQSSLTGHLVFSTLHTNDAPFALPRLTDMGIEPYLLASSLLGVIAQRLVRKICSACKVAYVPYVDEWMELGLEKEAQSGIKLFRGTGCEACFGTGYKGRHGIYELMHVTPKIKGQLLKSQDSEQFRQIAIDEGMDTLFQKGIQLVLQGITTSAEVLRVTRLGDIKG